MTEQNAKITSVSLGFEGHGILTCMIFLDYGNSQQGFGGYPLSTQFIKGVLQTLEVNTWEELPGEHIRVIANDFKIAKIGHILKDQWFDPTEMLKNDDTPK